MKKRLALVSLLSSVALTTPFAVAMAQECCGDVYSDTVAVVADEVVYGTPIESEAFGETILEESFVGETIVDETLVGEEVFYVPSNVVYETPEMIVGEVIEPVVYENEVFVGDPCECVGIDHVIYE